MMAMAKCEYSRRRVVQRSAVILIGLSQCFAIAQIQEAPPLDEFRCRTCSGATAFRVGDFSALSSPVIDHLTDSPFPNNVIPQTRLLPNGAWPEALYERNHREGTFNSASGSVAKLVAEGWTPLHEAVSNGSLSHPRRWLNRVRLDEILDEWSDALDAGLQNIGARSGWTPLHLAARRAYPGIVQLLLERGASVDARALDGTTPLHVVGSLEVFQALRAAGANVHARRDNGQTVLHRAATWTDAATVRALVAEGLDPDAATSEGWTPLHWAGSLEVFQTLRADGANIHARKISGPSSGWTVLHSAAIRTDAATVRELVAEGLDPNAATSEGVTPLHYAASREVFEALLELGADRSAIEAVFDLDAFSDIAGRVEGALSTAQLSRSVLQVGRFVDAAWFERLRAINSDFYAVPSNPRSSRHIYPLYYAARYNEDPAAVQALTGDAFDTLGWSVDANSGWRPLPNAARYNGNPAVVRALLEAGADVDADDNSALRGAVLNETPRAAQIVRILLEAGADIHRSGFNSTGSNRAPVYAAAMAQNLATLEALIMAGADVNVAGSTLHYSLLADVLSRGRFDCGYGPVAERLRSAGASAERFGAGAFTPGPQGVECSVADGATIPGTITTVAGPSAWGDGGPATQAWLNRPVGLAVDGTGNLYIVDGNRVRKVDVRTGIITTVAGTGEQGYSGDGGPATQARLNHPVSLALDTAGNLYIADYGNRRVRKVDAVTGIITTVAGTGAWGDGSGWP